MTPHTKASFFETMDADFLQRCRNHVIVAADLAWKMQQSSLRGEHDAVDTYRFLHSLRLKKLLTELGSEPNEMDEMLERERK